MASRLVRSALAGTTALALSALSVSPGFAHGIGDSPTAERGVKVAKSGDSKNMRFIANRQYKGTERGAAQNGSDIEFLKVGKREFALAGTLREGMQIVNITKPRKPFVAAVYDCAITQGDIQVWKHGKRILASYTADSTFGSEGAASKCARDLDISADDAGTVIVDLTTPTKPQSVSFLPVDRGSHNMTIHPSGDYLYNSNSDLITSTEPTITIYDISQPRQPKKVQDFKIPFTPTSLGSESHDITFNASGSRAYSAALSQTLVLNTTNPRKPRIVSNTIDPAVNVSHQADPVTMTRPNGRKRELLVVSDERAGAAGSVECPGGGLHIYDITGAKERDPEKIGTWYIDEIKPQPGTTCTSHVLRIYPKQKMMTVAWYSQGVRVVDISGLATYQGSPVDQAFGNGVGMREVGYYTMPDADTWSFKTNRINRNGSFFGYGNDLTRGFDVYRFNGADLRVPALKPKSLSSSTATFDGAMAVQGLAILAPAALLAGFLHRRRRRDAE